MKSRDGDWDDRIRAGLERWTPEPPASVDLASLQARAKGENSPQRHHPRSSGRGRWAWAASILLAGLLLSWFLGEETPKSTRQPLPDIRGGVFAERSHLEVVDPPLSTPAKERAAVERGDAQPPSPRRRVGAGVRVAHQASTPPRQIDIVMNLYEKKITLVWSQRSDFDLFDPERARRREAEGSPGRPIRVQ